MVWGKEEYEKEKELKRIYDLIMNFNFVLSTVLCYH